MGWKSTLNRLELTGRSPRYHKIGYSAPALDRLLGDLFLESHATPPTEIVLDLDAAEKSSQSVPSVPRKSKSERPVRISASTHR